MNFFADLALFFPYSCASPHDYVSVLTIIIEKIMVFFSVVIRIVTLKLKRIASIFECPTRGVSRW